MIMGSSGEAALLSAIRWQDQPVALKDFATRHPVPNIVKVTKGQYRQAIGVAKSVHSELYLHSVSTGKKVLVESVKIKDGKATCSQQKYGIPLSYQGWFEVLSENGQAVKPMFTMPELVASLHNSKNPNPTFLVREGLKGFTCTEEDGDLNKHCDVTVGEIITAGTEVMKNQATSKNSKVNRKFVPIITQSNNQTVFIPYDSKCKLSPIAGVQNISGVHNVQALLDKFRLPIMVRLVHGLIPTKLEKRFTAIFRLLRVYGDETVFFLPLKKDSKMVPISTREPLKVVAAANYEEVKDTPESEALYARCERMHASFMNSIHVLYSAPEPVDHSPPTSVLPPGKVPTGPKVEEDILFEEVEDIYMHVRQGGEPPPPRPRPANITGPPPIPKKEGKKSSIFGSFAKKIVRPRTTGEMKNTDVVVAASPKSPPTSPTSPLATTNEYQHPPPPLPDKTGGKNKDMDYWEEPIYEPLEKIRSMKQKQAKDTVIQMGSSPPQLLSDDNIEPIDNPIAQLNTSSDGEIKTLREVYKHTDSPHNGSSNSVNTNSQERNKQAQQKSHRKSNESPVHIPNPDYDIDVEPPAPPVPPKNFDETDEGKQTPDTKVGHKINVKQMSKIMSAGALPNQGNKLASQLQIGKSKSSGRLTASPHLQGNIAQKTADKSLPTSNSQPKLGATPVTGSPGQSQQPQYNRSTSNPNVSKPYLIKHVTASSKRAKGTTVHLEGGQEAHISTAPTPPIIQQTTQIRPVPTTSTKAVVSGGGGNISSSQHHQQKARPVTTYHASRVNPTNQHAQQSAVARAISTPQQTGNGSGSNNNVHKRQAPTPPNHGVVVAQGVASKMSSYGQNPQSSTALGGSPHPPFVAVARVGESYDQQRNPLYNNGEAVAHRVSMDHNRAKVQSMYL